MSFRKSMLFSRGHVLLIGQLNKGMRAIEMAAVDECHYTEAPEAKLAISFEPSVLSVPIL